MTSSNRISLILLVFFLLPTVVSSLRCYQNEEDAIYLVDCNSNEKCLKGIARTSKPGGLDFVYVCEDDTQPNGWSSREFEGTIYDVFVCDTDYCNSPNVVVPPPTTTTTTTTTSTTTTTTTTTTPSTTRDSTTSFVEPDSSTQAGVSWMCWCLMGVMMSWLLIFN